MAMNKKLQFCLYLLIFLNIIKIVICEEVCLAAQKDSCSSGQTSNDSVNKYKKETNKKWEIYKREISSANAMYTPCPDEKCSCHYPLIKADLAPFSAGISKKDIDDARPRGTLYQIIDHHLFRDKDCMFPSRCSGVEYFILKIIEKLPNMEFIINTRDWPQVPSHYGIKDPVFSFSKTPDYLDITYPAWTFWEGGPAISLYPSGLGRWDKFRKSLMKEAELWPWSKKKNVAFFRGSRTSAERDPLIYLSRNEPSLADAQYTKNQAWKSEADTLYAPPATEVSLESHCAFKYLFNYRGVAASFRLKHLFLCGSLVFHVGNDWIEFFYPQLKPWVHYIPVSSSATEHELRDLILFAKENDEEVSKIAARGYVFIRDHLRMKDVSCYWKKLLLSYHKLLKYQVHKREDLRRIR